MAWDLLVDGVSLKRWFVTDASTYRPSLSARAVLVDTKARHGVINVGLPSFDEPQVTLQLVPGIVPDPATLDVMVAELGTLLSRPGLSVTRTSDGRTEEAVARVVSLSPETDYDVRQGWVKYVATLALPGVFFRDPSPTSTTLAAGVSSHTALAGSAPVTDAVVRFAASGVGAKSLTDVTTGTGVGVDHTGSGYVYVDCSTLEAWASSSTSAWSPTGTDVSAKVDYPGPGPLQLWPTFNGAERTVTVDASHAAVVRARRAWL